MKKLTKMKNKIHNLNLKISTKKVDAEVRVLKSKYEIVEGTPDFGMSDTARKTFGLSNPIKYWIWKLSMKRKWKRNEAK